MTKPFTKQSALMPIVALVLVASSMFGNFAIGHEGPVEDQIQVLGTGEINAEPDQVVLTVSVYAVEPDQATAKRKADSAYQAVLGQIAKYGIADADVKVTRLAMNPEYEWTDNQRQHRGERVSRTLAITVNDVSVLSDLLQALVEQGVSEVNSMQAGFQDSAAIKQRALALAVNDAKQKASFLAKQLDRSRGAALQIIEQNSDVPMFRGPEMAMSRSRDADAPPPEMLGTQAIRATIQITFRLQ
ncbi:SIMPL domain-containing protein [Arenicella xantha]|uniref:Uncharacterized protein YggE n=1 Tax=Arenicella xantha TaxID=644221 RepID=A0A395JPT7_9GAMM|nr:SIMPL domain-containing protein [Arenicella xantha]RBP53619.1 uncharacterized protein YggE [Arenicella xantha]